MIHVCPLSKLHETVINTGAFHIVTLLRDADRIQRPLHVPPQNHLVLGMDDITEPMDGYTPPNEEHIVRLVEFLKAWDRGTPLVMHCFAGISRSTAAAFIAACAINPRRSEAAIAAALREASPMARPNSLLVKHADTVLRRNGRMVEAIRALSEASLAAEGDSFRLILD